ncbi:hypothetical protein LCGC14_2298590, partial [marine sediment metagenome]
RNQSVGKAKIVKSLPALGDVEIGELIYEETNGRLYIRRIDGWKYVTMNT